MNSILHRVGFQQMGELAYELPLQLWWHAREKIQVSAVNLRPYFLLKGTKSYFMKGITPEGELFARDINSLHDYLETFPEVHISFFHFRDVTPSSILRRIRDRKMRDAGVQELSLEQKEAALEDIKRQFSEVKNKLANTEALMNLDSLGPSIAGNYLKSTYGQQKRELERLKVAGHKLEGELLTTRKLLKEYEKKGAAAAYVFTVSSNLQAVYGKKDAEDALFSIVKELVDIHRYQITQKLGAKLNIYVEELEHPVLGYAIAYASGIFNPRQLARLGPHFHELRERVEQYLMVFPTSNITLGEHIKDERKRVGARVLQSFFKRLDRLPPEPASMPQLPEEGLWIGHILE